MKNIRSLILLLSALAFSETVYALSTESFRGPQEFRNRNFEIVSVNGDTNFVGVKLVKGSISGNVEFEDLVVKNLLDVKGNMSGIKANIEKLHLIGEGKLADVRIEDFNVTGAITLKNCNIKKINATGTITAASSSLGNIDTKTTLMVLQDSKANIIKIRRQDNVAQKLVLNNSSAKSVTFESGNGTISVVGSAEVTGKIVGATIIKE